MKKLHQFHLELIEHLRSNLRLCLKKSHAEHSRLPLSPPLLSYLTSDMPEKVVDFEREALLLNEDEFSELEQLFSWFPRDRGKWVPDRQLYRRSINCTAVVRRNTSSIHADEFSAMTDALIDRMLDPRATLLQGVEAVAELSGRLCDFLEAIDERRFIPRPLGLFPTPTDSDPSSSCDDPEAVVVIRARIAEHGKEASSKVILKSCGVGRQRGGAALRYLEGLGEYSGYCKAPPGRAKRDT